MRSLRSSGVNVRVSRHKMEDIAKSSEKKVVEIEQGLEKIPIADDEVNGKGEDDEGGV